MAERKSLNDIFLELYGGNENLPEWDVYREKDGKIAAFGFVFDIVCWSANQTRKVIVQVSGGGDDLAKRVEDIRDGEVFKLPEMKGIASQKEKYSLFVCREKLFYRAPRAYFFAKLRDLDDYGVVKVVSNYCIKPIFVPEWIRRRNLVKSEEQAIS